MFRRKTMDKIAVLIPCYNEEKTIEKVVKDAKAALPEAVVYVYDKYIISGYYYHGYSSYYSDSIKNNGFIRFTKSKQA